MIKQILEKHSILLSEANKKYRCYEVIANVDVRKVEKLKKIIDVKSIEILGGDKVAFNTSFEKPVSIGEATETLAEKLELSFDNIDVSVNEFIAEHDKDLKEIFDKITGYEFENIVLGILDPEDTALELKELEFIDDNLLELKEIYKCIRKNYEN